MDAKAESARSAARVVPGAIGRLIQQRREDKAFSNRLQKILEQDRAILDRLAH